MGGSSHSQPTSYAVEITKPIKGETGIYRKPAYKDGLKSIPKKGYKTVQELWLDQFKVNAQKEFLGQRPRLDDGNLESKYEWETYSQVEELCKAFGSGLINLKLLEEKAQYQNYKLKFLSIYSQNSREWIIVDTACCLYGITTIPIYDTLGEEATDHTFNETEASTCALVCHHLKAEIQRIKEGKVPHLKNLIIMDEWNLTSELKELLKGINYYKFTDLLKSGRETPQPLPTVKPEDIALFSYTSGTTGAPKGAMISHKNIIAMITGAEDIFPMNEIGEIVHLSYLPLAHVLERALLTFCAYTGGQYGIFNGDVRKLKDDLLLLKPTFFTSVPRLFNKFFDKMQGGLRDLSGCKASLAHKAVKSKMENLEKDGSYTSGIYDMLVFKKMKAALGGRVKYMLTGSAPISDEVRKFMKIAMCCPFSEGYGQTEALGGSFITDPYDKEVGNVGGPLCQNEYKLIDVPEMSYFSTDKDENGKPAPRGEILVRGANVIPGYYKNPEKSAETFDKDGWLHSGDIGQVLSHNQGLKIIDRRKNIFKLAQGEYIAPDKLEQVYKTARGVADIFVYGDSLKSSLIAFVNVDPDEYEKLAKELNISVKNIEEFCANSKANEYIMKELDRVNKSAQLKGFEKIRKVSLESVPFGDVNLVTTTFKLKRHEAKLYFKDKIDQLYVGMI